MKNSSQSTIDSLLIPYKYKKVPAGNIVKTMELETVKGEKPIRYYVIDHDPKILDINKQNSLKGSEISQNDLLEKLSEYGLSKILCKREEGIFQNIYLTIYIEKLGGKQNGK